MTYIKKSGASAGVRLIAGLSAGRFFYDARRFFLKNYWL